MPKGGFNAHIHKFSACKCTTISWSEKIKFSGFVYRVYDLNKDQATKKDALFNLLNNNYQIRYETSIYGVTLLDIDSIKTDFRNSYIAIYIDDKYSNFGISSINLYDGIKISLKETRIWQ